MNDFIRVHNEVFRRDDLQGFTYSDKILWIYFTKDKKLRFEYAKAEEGYNQLLKQLNLENI